ncbi:MAG: UDP-N-acetyl-D-glucosamine dehydrogenase, partial [Lachnospiraceae bacterium]|nr:UDP-N-acetyl-D-glucosamine dehydrogenase [Lachnospiraceae bacterium]
KELKKLGAKVSYYDPWVKSFKNMYGESGESLPELTAEVVSSQDLVLITAAHKNVDYDMVQRNAKAILDTKNVMKTVKEKENVEVL